MVVPDDAKNRILLKATNIDEAIRKAEKHYKCEKKVFEGIYYKTTGFFTVGHH